MDLDVEKMRMWALETAIEVYEGEGFDLISLLAEADRIVRFVTTGKIGLDA